MQVKQVDESSIRRMRLPFPALGHASAGELTLRPEGERWASLRIEGVALGHPFTVKEFYLDWFYPGFPKNLMSSFVDSYSNVVAFSVGTITVHTGRDYRGEQAASLQAGYTHAEIRYRGGTGVLRAIVQGLYGIGNPVPETFVERSFLARHAGTGWFEEERVSRMLWRPIGREIELGDGALVLDSFGVYREGQASHCIAVYRQGSAEGWIDFTDSTAISHSLYAFRDGNFLRLGVRDGMALLSGEMTPVLYRFDHGGFTFTVSVPMGSPLSYRSIRQLAEEAASLVLG
ncbi:hypothetical protein GCM10007108_15550 [Thermogymnomonas acidicola]|uniref:Uncharacterized protein n=1 Tax=Thermogymnomonas acidicola TaxID=399579 RepID=A0AA37BSU3_9ARCH|nr:hypothetical protein [Thermogymnomonas acidicola]GGM78291.1 hypothetical protein GCM10007108_15550 [Thermogymnomonas acidicola]